MCKHIIVFVVCCEANLETPLKVYRGWAALRKYIKLFVSSLHDNTTLDMDSASEASAERAGGEGDAEGGGGEDEIGTELVGPPGTNPADLREIMHMLTNKESLKQIHTFVSENPNVEELLDNNDILLKRLHPALARGITMACPATYGAAAPRIDCIGRTY